LSVSRLGVVRGTLLVVGHYHRSLARSSVELWGPLAQPLQDLVGLVGLVDQEE
ncbi:hypothetical protein KI387_011321, partial [Taxus chinensis]